MESDEILLEMINCVRCIAYYDHIDKFKEVYYNLINARHRGCITKIKPELDSDHLKITITMGVNPTSK